MIVKTRGALAGGSLDVLPDRLYLEAAALAAWFSSCQHQQKVEVDYSLRKNL